MTDTPSPEALAAADTWSAAGNINLKMLATAFDEFARLAVEGERERCRWIAASDMAEDLAEAIASGGDQQ